MMRLAQLDIVVAHISVRHQRTPPARAPPARAGFALAMQQKQQA